MLTNYEQTGAGNEILDRGDFRISYNPAPFGGVIGGFGSDNGSDETAICTQGDFFILNGDYREEYARLASEGGLRACLQFFLDNDRLMSSWSDSPDEARAYLADLAA